MGAADDSQALVRGPERLQTLVRRLEELLTERLDLVEQLDRHAPERPSADTDLLRRRLAQLADEQARVLSELAILLPPDGPAAG